jgi:release factor glutamine methyltransferase
MFVNSNKVKDLKKYFNCKLEKQFSQNEIKLMFHSFLRKRLKLSKAEILFSDELLLSESDLLFFREQCHKLLSNEPFQYLIAETEFYGLTIKCDKRALIPRPETEELLDWICETFRNKLEKLNFIDFCTGSGCIALAIKQNFPNSNIIATDISQDALELAKENSTENNLKITFVQDNILKTCLEVENDSLDCIVSNPPYIPMKDKLLMHENVLNHEPHVALFVEDDDALIFYKKIAQIAQLKLNSTGNLFFEIHENLAKDVNELLKTLNFQEIIIKKDLQGKNRMIRARKC